MAVARIDVEIEAVAAALLATLAVPASAQNAGQIASVRRGASCAGCNLFQGDFSGLEARGLNLSRSRLRQADLSLSVMNRTRFFNAMPSERDVLRVEERAINARLDNDCGGS